MLKLESILNGSQNNRNVVFKINQNIYDLLLKDYSFLSDYPNIIQILKDSSSDSIDTPERRKSLHNLFRLLERHF